MDRAELNEDFTDLLRCMLDAGVDFVIVGAHALAAHGHPRATGDLDVLVAPSRENAPRVIEALHRFGAPLAQHGVTQAYFEATDNVYQIGLPPRRIDVLTSITGVSYDEASSTKIVVELAGMSLPVLGREAFVKNKRALGRPKDLGDIAAIEEKP